MPPDKKILEVEKLTDKLSRMSVAVITDIRGMSVNAMTDLRQHLREQGIEYRVVKNTLAARAADASGHPEIKQALEGSVGLILGYADPIQPVKSITDYVRTNRSPATIIAAVLDGRVFRGQQLAALATTPPREILAAQLVGQLASPMVRLATVLSQPVRRMVTVIPGPLRNLTTVLQQRIGQQGGG